MRRSKALSKYVVIGIVAILIVIAAVAAFLMQAPPTEEKPTASPTPAPTKVELTGNFETDVVEVGKALEANGISEVTYSVWAAGDPNSVIRVLGIVEAANRINKIWSDNNVNVEINIETRFEREFMPLFEEFLSKQPTGQASDFLANSYIYISTLAEEGYILDITDYVSKYSELVNDFYPTIFEAVKWKGRIYALPQDTEARPLYFRKDVAACAGLDLTGLADKVRNGEFTWSDVYNWAKQAKESGCAEWGVIHRKGSAHPDLIQFIYAFGGRLYNPDTGKLVIDKEAIYKWLYVEWKMARDGLIPENMMEWDWGTQIHPTTVHGKTLIFIGGTWHWTEWQTRSYYTDPTTGEPRGLTAEEVKEFFYYTLFPAGESGKDPVTLSQPFVWVINSRAGERNPKYDTLKELYHELAFLILVKASDPDINAIHSIISSHLPVRKASAQLMADEDWVNRLKNLELDLSDEVKDQISEIVAATVNPINTEFLANVSYMLDYTHIAPIHPLYPKLADILKDAVDMVLRNQKDPAAAVQYIIDTVNADPDLAAEVEVIGEIPSGWSYP